MLAPIVVSYRNSTSNHNLMVEELDAQGLYLIEILHQTTTVPLWIRLLPSCILSKFYIKPQPAAPASPGEKVVSYRNSTSNHNFLDASNRSAMVVSYRNSTSNHNLSARTRMLCLLYLIEILHQTTTPRTSSYEAYGLYLIEILHQTTTARRNTRRSMQLYLIEILHQTTTSGLILIDKVLLTGCLPL